MISFLTFPIRLVGIVLMVAFTVRAMEPLRSLELSLFEAAGDPNSAAIARVTTPSSNGSSLLSFGLALVAIIAIWLIYHTWQQHITLANNGLKNRRAAKSK